MCAPQVYRRGQAELAAEEREALLNGPPFMIMMRCQAKQEAHTTEYFVFPLGRAPGTRKRRYRLCKVCHSRTIQGSCTWLLT